MFRIKWTEYQDGEEFVATVGNCDLSVMFLCSNAWDYQIDCVEKNFRHSNLSSLPSAKVAKTECRKALLKLMEAGL